MTEARRRVYCGADLHGSNVVLSICEEDGKRIRERRVKSELDAVLDVLDSYREDLAQVAVESTYNWYWFVDGLREEGVPVVMANPARLGAYSGIKETNDFTDARWLAELARLDVIPESYVYPRAERAVRDLLRRRSLLVRQRTGLGNSLAAWRARHAVALKESEGIGDVEGLNLPRYVRLESCVLLKASARLQVLIKDIEKDVLELIKPTEEYRRLQKIPGIGPILGMTIVLESGEFSRFRSSAHYASYSRTVRSRRTSNGKAKGSNNARNGNRHLAWAYSEAAHFVTRYDPLAKAWFERKKKWTNAPVAYKSLASKLSKAVWHIMQGEDYEPQRLFG